MRNYTLKVGAIMKAIASVLEQIDKKVSALEREKSLINAEIQKALRRVAVQEDGSVLTFALERGSWIRDLGFSLVGDFADWDGPGKDANILSLENGICGGDWEEDILKDWLSPECLKIVSKFFGRISAIRFKGRYLLRTKRKLYALERFLETEEWELQSDLEELELAE